MKIAVGLAPVDVGAAGSLAAGTKYFAQVRGTQEAYYREADDAPDADATDKAFVVPRRQGFGFTVPSGTKLWMWSSDPGGYIVLNVV